MPTKFCTYKFVAGTKKGQTCNTFLRGSGHVFCYKHRKQEPNQKLEELPEMESKPVLKMDPKSPTKEKIIPAEKSEESSEKESKPKKAGNTKAPASEPINSKSRNQTLQMLTEVSEESHKPVTPSKGFENKTKAPVESQSLQKAKVIELEISSSSSESSDFSSDSESTTDSDASTDQ